jgi:Kef-type K+ transport system membrane component KefB
MQKVLMYSCLLVGGLVLSQVLPGLMGPAAETYAFVVRMLTMTALSFIMIHVGFEFDIDKKNMRKYGWDYVVAATAAGFPWIFCAAYFIFVLIPQSHWWDFAVWKETLLASRFAAPTSAGVLFSMLAAAGLAATWVFRKARVLAIFDDLDTVLLMIPLKMMMVGVRWQLGVIVLIMAVQLWLAWKYLHRLRIPIAWPFVFGYSVAIVAVAEVVYLGSKQIDPVVPIHIEVLLPAFVLGCMIARPRGQEHGRREPEHGAGDGNIENDHEPVLETPAEQRVSTIVSAAFMMLVGLSMPVLGAAASAGGAEGAGGAGGAGDGPPTLVANALATLTPSMGWGTILVHVLLVTVVANIGKMFPALCYRREAHWRERLAVAVGMWPRGEVGAGVLVVSLSYGISGPIVTIAMLSLALNLVLTGVFIVIVRRLLDGVPAHAPAGAGSH